MTTKEIIERLKAFDRYELEAANMHGDIWLSGEIDKDGEWVKHEEIEQLIKDLENEKNN